ncbi:hypothetical protein DESC_270009 [Desulfosarcina cetonica]|nr:hypothetical protein DESC_270009 [Desulfosarcina cetonica]
MDDPWVLAFPALEITLPEPIEDCPKGCIAA